MLVAWLVAALLRTWIRTLRYRRLGPAIDRAGLVAFWHGEQLPLIGARPAGRLVAPVSTSPDGQLQEAVLHRVGIDGVRGSRGQGGAAAARGLLRALRAGSVALMAVDGPSGPRGVVKPGVVYLAQRTGLPVWPVAVAVARGRRLEKAWDRYLLPRPFTRTVVLVGEPILVEPDAVVGDARSALQVTLEALAADAEAEL
jgi:hypothetical protein